MVETAKDNLKTLFSYLSPKIQTLSQFDIYFRQIYFDLTTRSENQITALDLNRFHIYMQLPYHISKQLFKSFLQSNQFYLTIEELQRGMKGIYLESIPNQVRLLFDFYDINKEGVVFPYDIRVILRQFHMMTNSSDISLLDNILSNALTSSKAMDYAQWKELLVNNSDVFVLTVLFFHHHKPYKEDNVIYCSKAVKAQVIAKDIPSKTVELLADSTEQLFDYINKHLDISFEYIPHASSDNDADMKELMSFEEDKMALLNSLKEISMMLSSTKPVKKRFDTEIPSDSFPIKEELRFDRKKRGKEVASTTIQSNLVLNKLSLINGRLTPCDGKESKGKFAYQNIRYDCLMLHKSNLKKFSLNLFNDELYLFKFSKQNVKKHKQTMTLKEFFIDCEDNSKIQGGKYFKIDLYSDIDYKPYSTTFFFETKDSGVYFMKNLREVRRYKEKITDDYEIGNELLKEHNGSLFRAFHKKNLNTFLIKQIAKKGKDTPSYYELINWELSVFAFLTKANHPSLIKAIERYEDLKIIYLVYEFPTEGQLLYYLQKNQMTINKKMDVFSSIVSSVHYLHSFGIVFGNCIASNAFVFKNKQTVTYKLISFEYAQVCSYSTTMPQLSEPYLNKAPELFDGRNVFERSIDVWNLGQLLFLIIYGHSPYSDKDSKKTKLVFPELSLDINDQFLQTIKEIISGCLQSERKKRLSLEKISDLCRKG